LGTAAGAVAAVVTAVVAVMAAVVAAAASAVTERSEAAIKLRAMPLRAGLRGLLMVEQQQPEHIAD
jgi:NADH:ubiquinone oxidoreductase subunit H